VAKITGTLREDQQAVLIIYLSVLLRMSYVSGQCCTENQNTHFMLKNLFLILPFMKYV